MARLESVAIGGYYPTPPEVVALLSQHITLDPKASYAYLDPCAGEGDAILSLRSLLCEKPGDLYSIEMEQERYKTLKGRLEASSWHCSSKCLHGDAFRAHWDFLGGVSLLYLNPPYDLDPKHKRLEERFLSRFTSVLAAGGVLVFVVPFYALAASASTLARCFDRVECFRFPAPGFDAFKQVILLATKRKEDLFSPDPEVEAKILSWAAGGDIPELGSIEEPFRLPPVREYHILDNWGLIPFDYPGLISEIKPWHQTDRSGKLHPMAIVSEASFRDSISRTYPVAMPPRSAHIASGIAAGIFNGVRIEPDTSSILPPILVKGVFDKEYRTVEQKTDKKGNVKGLVQVQQPKLVTTVLDLRAGIYSTITPSVERTYTTSVQGMTMADLLAEYGRGLMGTMLRQCPVLHNPQRPDHAIPLPSLARPLFEAQSQATQATVKLLGGLGVSQKKRRFQSAFILGEIGSGKTSVALAAMEAIRAKRTLVMCPPHLLDSWKEQVQAVTPWVRTVVLSSIADVQALAGTDDHVIVILSRETAKLGHAIEGVRGRCPKCGAFVPEGDHGKLRSRCQAKGLKKLGKMGDLVEDIALTLAPLFPNHPWIKQVLVQPNMQRALQRMAPKNIWEKAKERLQGIARVLAQGATEPEWSAAIALCTAIPQPELLADVADIFFHKDNLPYTYENVHVDLLLLADSPTLEEKANELEQLSTKTYYYNSPWKGWLKQRDALWRWASGYSRYGGPNRKDGALTWRDLVVGDPKSAIAAIEALAPNFLALSKVCGEPLFQAVPQPRRYPLATYIARRYPRLFDFLILDEGHEYASGNSAQSHAAHRLTSLGIPTILLTGTIMNGYADSMFVNTWALSQRFREEFNRDEQTRFTDRYGYRKRIVEERDKDTGEVLTFGSMSDRVERSERLTGKAPGVLPIFLFQHLLPSSVTLHKADLSADIPNCKEETVTVTPLSHQLREYQRLEQAILTQISKDRFVPDLAGKLWGALAQFPSYLDLATSDTGNEDSGYFTLAYPESVGGNVVAQSSPLPSNVILPKEQWMLDRVQSSLQEGRQVLVFAWHTNLLPRLARLVKSHLGIRCPILNPAKVPTAKRQAWIDHEVVKNKCPVLVVNPVAIQTGLNNLVYFSDEIWMENPACNPITYRQAVGRVDRIGQQEETRIYFPLYDQTAQQELHSLLLHKVAVSMATDGLDAEGALQAAGIGEDSSGFSSFAIGRQLYDLLTSSRRPPASRRACR